MNEYDTLIVRIEELNQTIEAAIGFGWVFLGFSAMLASGLLVIWFTLKGH